LGKLESDLDKLDRQNSDDDLVLMSELADSAGSTRHASGDEAESKAEELGVKVAKTQGDEDDISLDDLETLGLLKEDLPAYDFPEGDLWEDDLPEADLLEENFLEEEPPIVAPGAPRVLNESDLGGNDDFDFLTGTDEAATKLDLAQAYVEMGDVDGARDMLMEVELEGTAEQKAEAKELLNNLS
jgi:pilus assembly protein FimV